MPSKVSNIEGMEDEYEHDHPHGTCDRLTTGEMDRCEAGDYGAGRHLTHNALWFALWKGMD